MCLSLQGKMLAVTVAVVLVLVTMHVPTIHVWHLQRRTHHTTMHRLWAARGWLRTPHGAEEALCLLHPHPSA